MTDDSYHMPIYALVSVSESVSVKFSVLYLVSKVSEKSGIGPLLLLIECMSSQKLYLLANMPFIFTVV